jgi:hypothetical protein
MAAMQQKHHGRDWTKFKEAYPDFQLEDELFAGGVGGRVMDTFFGKRYSRKKKEGATAGQQG